MNYPEDFINKIICGDCLEVMKDIPDNSVDLVVTSPPYWGLRDYRIKGQVGLEETPENYVKKLAIIFNEIKRILKNKGTVWLNLGDTYYGSGAGQKDTGKAVYNQEDFRQKPLTKKHKFLKPKDMTGIPFRTAFALQKDGWWLRQAIIWYKPNAMPENVKDRPTTDYEFVFLLTKSKKYYYDYEAILEPYTKPLDRWGGNNLKANGESDWDKGTGQKTYRKRNMRPNPKGRNRRAVWSMNTVPSLDIPHYATFPEELPELCIKAGTKDNDIILDPFLGSGTTTVVCKKLNRRFIGIEINPEYCKIAEERLKKVPKRLDKFVSW